MDRRSFNLALAGSLATALSAAALATPAHAQEKVKCYGVSMAGALIASLPTLLVYILLGRYFVGGLMAGAVKG